MNATIPQRYCIDTSSLLAIRSLDADVFSGIWDALSEAVTNGTLHAPHEVFRELSKIDDTVTSWAKKNKSMFFDPDQILVDKVAEVQEKYKFYDIESMSPKADPFLVAHGALKGCAVITQEKPQRPDKMKAKIPDACDHFGVRVLNLSDFFREQGWQFIGKQKA